MSGGYILYKSLTVCVCKDILESKLRWGQLSLLEVFHPASQPVVTLVLKFTLESKENQDHDD